MKKQLLFMHSAGSQENGEGSSQLVALLKAELGANYDILAPIMPDPDNPDSAAWQAAFGEHLNTLEAPFILVGHSLGASTILKYLSENTITTSPDAIFLIATPFWDSEGWEVREYALNEGFVEHLPDVPITFYHSQDDDVVPFSHLLTYEEKIPQATVRKLEGYGHFLELSAFPELFADLWV